MTEIFCKCEFPSKYKAWDFALVRSLIICALYAAMLHAMNASGRSSLDTSMSTKDLEKPSPPTSGTIRSAESSGTFGVRKIARKVTRPVRRVVGSWLQRLQFFARKICSFSAALNLLYIYYLPLTTHLDDSLAAACLAGIAILLSLIITLVASYVGWTSESEIFTFIMACGGFLVGMTWWYVFYLAINEDLATNSVFGDKAGTGARILTALIILLIIAFASASISAFFLGIIVSSDDEALQAAEKHGVQRTQIQKPTAYASDMGARVVCPH